ATPSSDDSDDSDSDDDKSEDKEETKSEDKKEDKSEPAKEEKKEEPKQDSSLNTSAKVNNGDNVPYVTPLVRKLADKHGVDLNSIEGTGVGGRIRKQDVLAAAGEGDAKASAGNDKKAADSPRARWSTKSVDPEKQELIGTTKKVNRIREITATKMVEALQI
ncbi:TPA: E3 binding domain-containing protein, partial [Staphylococcus aureus]|nr:E3 binding domain-containing protein [Staphylococcus aureus]